MLRLHLKEKVDIATQKMWFRDILGKSKVSVDMEQGDSTVCTGKKWAAHYSCSCRCLVGE